MRVLITDERDWQARAEAAEARIRTQIRERGERGWIREVDYEPPPPRVYDQPQPRHQPDRIMGWNFFPSPDEPLVLKPPTRAVDLDYD